MPNFTSANFPMTPEGRVYHLALAPSEIAPLILTVGDHTRATLISTLFTSSSKPILSSRGFLTITGVYKNTPVSVVGIGMGISMMDFFVREARAIVEGPMRIIRLGSCGSIDGTVVGSIVVCEAAVLVQRDCDAIAGEGAGFILSEPCTADSALTQKLRDCLEGEMENGTVCQGWNATADSFYSTQGRIDPSFDDNNADLFATILEKYPSVKSMEMETFMLLHLAKCCKVEIRAAAFAMVFADRIKDEFIAHDRVADLEIRGARAALDALAATDI